MQLLLLPLFCIMKHLTLPRVCCSFALSCYLLVMLIVPCIKANVPRITVQNRLQLSTVNRPCTNDLDCTLGDDGECREGKCQCSLDTLLDQTETCVEPCYNGVNTTECENGLYCSEQRRVCSCPPDQVRDKFRNFCKYPTQPPHTSTTSKDYCLYDASCGQNAFCHEPTNSCRCMAGYKPAPNDINCQLIYCDDDDFTCLLYHDGTKCDIDSNTCQCEELTANGLGWDTECSATTTTTERVTEYINSNNDPSPSPNIAQIIFAIVILVIITIAIYSLCTCICSIPKARINSRNTSRNSSASNSPQRNRRPVDAPPKYSEAIHCSLPSYSSTSQEPAPEYKTCFGDSKIVHINCELPSEQR